MITKEFHEPSSIHAIPMQNVTKTKEQKKNLFFYKKKKSLLNWGKATQQCNFTFFFIGTHTLLHIPIHLFRSQHL